MHVSIVIPTYNERENIRILIPALVNIMRENNISGEIIVVDDNSADGTAEEVERISKIFAEEFHIHVIVRERKMGIGSAYKTGFANTTGDVIFEMDGDLSHDPAMIPEFLKMLRTYDVVVGSRYMRGNCTNNQSNFRRIISIGANMIARKLLQLSVRDATSGYRAYKRNVIKSIDMNHIHSEGYAFQVEMVYKVEKKGFKIGEIPIIFRDRTAGRSKLGTKEVVRFFLIVLKLALFDRRPGGIVHSRNEPVSKEEADTVNDRVIIIDKTNK
ncbi:MAG: polyprenol monophosphomannose synthase [Canidatus Methanoxibalbensis ujae]|nr:polyprenol monophosphomannose synthase [Candidatus Methanoxibalbensis ujae]